MAEGFNIWRDPLYKSETIRRLMEYLTPEGGTLVNPPPGSPVRTILDAPPPSAIERRIPVPEVEDAAPPPALVRPPARPDRFVDIPPRPRIMSDRPFRGPGAVTAAPPPMIPPPGMKPAGDPFVGDEIGYEGASSPSPPPSPSPWPARLQGLQDAFMIARSIEPGKEGFMKVVADQQRDRMLAKEAAERSALGRARLELDRAKEKRASARTESEMSRWDEEITLKERELADRERRTEGMMKGLGAWSRTGLGGAMTPYRSQRLLQDRVEMLMEAFPPPLDVASDPAKQEAYYNRILLRAKRELGLIEEIEE